ncbi:MAG: L-threonylcarbamoyladenylate synthase [Oscillospiraceae bacterium]
MIYETKILAPTDEGINIAAELLIKGEVVGIPTETVYGLAADATNQDAVKKIFLAKGRPQDNPLICHIADISSLELYVKDVPDIAYKLSEKFWPGPLTMVLPKKDIIPLTTSGGLDTVGMRFPSSKIAQEIIKASGTTLAAPSANLSGSPSPTTAMHVFDDMQGRVPAIVDGGACNVGVESTVVSFENDYIRILRPGYISLEDFLSVTDKVITDNGILNKISDCDKVRSPGMKYKHYSPKANVVIVEGDIDEFTKYVFDHNSNNTYSMIFDSDKSNFPFNFLTYGDTSEQQAHEIFDKLREFDKIGAGNVFVRSPSKNGVGLAVYNRLLRAAGFEVVKL